MANNSWPCGHLTCRLKGYLSFLQADRRALVAAIVCLVSLVALGAAALGIPPP
jgi:hypothetical protein